MKKNIVYSLSVFELSRAGNFIHLDSLNAVLPTKAFASDSKQISLCYMLLSDVKKWFSYKLHLLSIKITSTLTRLLDGAGLIRKFPNVILM